MPFYESLMNLPPILDFEASSLDLDNSYPIALGLVIGGHCYEWLIRPEPEWTDWNARSEALHGISRAQLKKQGLPASEVCEKAKQLLNGNQLVYSDAYDWDGMWARRLGLSNVKVAHAANLLAPDKGAHLGEQQYAARIRYGLRQHNAMDDALALAFALHALQ